MKFVGLAIILASLPLFIFWMQNASNRKFAYFLVGVFPMTIDAFHFSVTLVDWSMWSGYVKGLPVTLLDTLAVAILVTHRFVRPNLWFTTLFVAYIGMAALSVAFADIWLASAFYLFQLARIFIVFLAVTVLARDISAVRWLAAGLAAGIILQAVVAVYQKAHGVAQPSGTLAHQNMLGMMTHFVLFILVGLMLARKANALIIFGVFGAMISIALSGSRATVGLAGPGLFLLLLLSSARHMTSGKMRMIGASIAAVVVAIPLAFRALAERAFHNDPVSSDRLRASMESAAHLMIAENPMGVGANQYVVVANIGGYSTRAGVAWNMESRATNVHNLYLLTAAEMSWLAAGLIGGLFAAVVGVSLSFWWSNRRDPRAEVVLGIAVATAVVAVHSLFEWIFVTSNVQYFFAIAMGIVSGMVAGRKREQAELRRAARAARAAVRDLAAGSEPQVGTLRHVR